MMSLRNILALTAGVALAAARAGAAELDFYAGPTINEYSMLHDTRTATGFQVGAVAWLPGNIGFDAGVADTGRVDNGFPVQATYPPGEAFPQYVLQTQGTNSLSVSSSSAYALVEARVHLGDSFGAWLGIGPEKSWNRATSNLQIGYPNFHPTYSGKRSPGGFMARTGLDFQIAPSLSLELEAHYSISPAFNNFSFYPQYVNADIGSQQLQVLGGAINLVWRLK
jgi:opacity protein-like surface antigen